MKFITALAGVALFAQQSSAHPGDSPEEHAREITQRNAYLSTHKRSLTHCADTLKARGNDIAMAHRRSVEVKKMRAKRAIDQGMPTIWNLSSHYFYLRKQQRRTTSALVTSIPSSKPHTPPTLQVSLRILTPPSCLLATTPVYSPLR